MLCNISTVVSIMCGGGGCECKIYAWLFVIDIHIGTIFSVG